MASSAVNYRYYWLRYALTYFTGIDRTVNEALINTNAARDAQNIDTEKGTLKTTNGFTKYSAFPVGGITKIESIIPFYDDYADYLLICGNGKIVNFEVATGNSVLIMSGMTKNVYDYLNFKVDNTRVLILGNGYDNTQIFDGSTMWDLKLKGKNSTPASDNKAPKGKFMELHYERVWIAGDVNAPDRLYFSTANSAGFDPNDWTIPLTEGDVNQHGGIIDCPTWDGGKIIGLKTIFDDLVIFKDHTIFKITGTDPSNYNKSQIFTSEGAIADKSIIAVNNKAYFLSKDGIHAYDGVNVATISSNLRDIFDNLNPSYITNAVATYYNNRYIIAVPEGSSIVNNLIIEYNIINKTWMVIRGTAAATFCLFNDVLLLAGGDNCLYQYDSGHDNNGADIVSYWETGMTDLGHPESKKSIQYLYVTGSGSGQVKLTISTETTSDTKPAKSALMTLTDEPSITKLKLKNKGRRFNIRIENVDGSNFEINSIKPTMDVDAD